MAIFSLSAFYGKDVSNWINGKGDFSGEDKPEGNSETFCDESTDDRDGYVDESDEESLTNIAISQSFATYSDMNQASELPPSTVEDLAVSNVFHEGFDD